MAGRPRKPTVEFFPMEVHAVDNLAVRSLIKVKGIGALGVLLVVWCRMYDTRGGEFVLHEGPASDILKGTPSLNWLLLLGDTGLEPRELFSVLDTAVNVELFNKKMWQEKGTLSSAAVKERIANILKRRQLWRKRTDQYHARNEGDNSVKMVQYREKRKEDIKRIVDKRGPVVTELFEKLWASYPRQIDKPAAFRHFALNYDNAPNQHFDRMHKAITNYCAWVKAKKTEPQFIIGAGKFFEHRWMEWVDRNPNVIKKAASALAADIKLIEGKK